MFGVRSAKVSRKSTDLPANGSSHAQLAACELELRKRASRATLDLHGRDFRAEAAEVHFVYCFLSRLRKFSRVLLSHSSRAAEVYFSYYFRTEELRLSSWGCESVLRVRLL